MKITTTAGLVGFLLALSSVNIPKADATTIQNSPAEAGQSTIESRLGRIAKVIKEKENQTEGALENNTDSPYIVGQFVNINLNNVGFLNTAPSFINRYYGWPNRYHGWGNGGFHNYNGWHNGGGGFANRGGSFANRGGGSGFANRGGSFANGGHGGFANRGGGGFANRGGGGFANR